MNKKYGLLVLIIAISIAIIFGYNNNYKVNKLDNVGLENKTNDDMFAIMIENVNGYEESNNNEWPDSTYIFNNEKSGCMDISGKKVQEEGILTFENNKATVSTSKTVYCYLYFDKKPLTIQELLDSHPANLNTEIQGSMYRYQGASDVVDNNYICFGTKDKNECVNNPDIYMYRIIGIVGDSTDSTVSKNMVKVIKMTSLKEGTNNKFEWYFDHYSGWQYAEELWSQTPLKKRLNGESNGEEAGEQGNTNIFLNSSNSLYPYMQESIWLDKIIDKKWYEGSINYQYMPKTAIEAFNIEHGIIDSSYYIYGDVLETKRFSLSNNFKISILNLSDYYWSMSREGTDCFDESNKEICKSSWLHFSNNDNSVINEFVATRNGRGPGANAYYLPWRINKEGNVYDCGVYNHICSIRPTFYLINNIILSGFGTLNSPFIITN